MKIEKLFVDRHLRSSDETEKIKSNLNMGCDIVSDESEVFEWVSASDDPVLKGKQTLYITENRGAAARDCPGTSHYTCCGYTILHTGTYCSMDCSYCILQAYYHPPVLRYFADRKNQISMGLNRLFNQNRIFRVGTGEFTDSLIWEAVSDQVPFLVKCFASQDNCILELKTKTANIESLKSLDHNEKTILAWSLNTPEIVKTEERGTAGINARLKAAARWESWGYKLAFHFDPLILYQGCHDHYSKVIARLFSEVSPENIVWISLGSFRFMPQLKPIIEKRFPRSRICYGEFVRGMDNKMRYFKKLRIHLYKEILNSIKKFAPKVTTYFCMEDSKVWESCLNMDFKKDDGLARMLDESAVEHCGLNKHLL